MGLAHIRAVLLEVLVGADGNIHGVAGGIAAGHCAEGIAARDQVIGFLFVFNLLINTVNGDVEQLLQLVGVRQIRRIRRIAFDVKLHLGDRGSPLLTAAVVGQRNGLGGGFIVFEGVGSARIHIVGSDVGIGVNSNVHLISGGGAARNLSDVEGSRDQIVGFIGMFDLIVFTVNFDFQQGLHVSGRRRSRLRVRIFVHKIEVLGTGVRL